MGVVVVVDPEIITTTTTMEEEEVEIRSCPRSRNGTTMRRMEEEAAVETEQEEVAMLTMQRMITLASMTLIALRRIRSARGVLNPKVCATIGGDGRSPRTRMYRRDLVQPPSWEYRWAVWGLRTQAAVTVDHWREIAEQTMVSEIVVGVAFVFKFKNKFKVI